MFRSFYSRLVSPSVLRNVTSVETLLAKCFSSERPSIEKGINQVLLLGRCGGDAIRRGTEAKPLAILSLATHTHYRTEQSDDIHQKTEWHRIIVFRPRLMEKTINFAKKGSRLLVQGKISYGEVSDANGVTHQTTSIVADEIVFLSSKRTSNEAELDTDEEIAA